MRHFGFKVIGGVLACAWIAALGIGASKLWQYDSAPGVPASAPPQWPAATTIPRDSRLPTLIMLVHPQCPCSRASVYELARLMAHCDGKLQAVVLFIRPPEAPAGWERSELWSDAQAIPGVTVRPDDNGRESARFGAATSGQTLLYAADGRLVFAGGITESRGHGGDNVGESDIQKIVLNSSPDMPPPHATTPVYGCPLFSQETGSTPKGCPACRQ